MTTLAFDGRYLAADTMISGFPKTMRFCKIFRHQIGRKIIAIAGCGAAAGFAPAIAWYLQGRQGEFNFSIKLLVIEATLGEAVPDVILVEHDGQILTCPQMIAEGSGGPYAYGALLAGASAAEAIQAAALIDDATNDDVSVLDLLTGKWAAVPVGDSEAELHRSVARYLPTIVKAPRAKKKAAPKRKKPQ